MIGHSLGRVETCFGWDPDPDPAPNISTSRIRCSAIMLYSSIHSIIYIMIYSRWATGLFEHVEDDGGQPGLGDLLPVIPTISIGFNIICNISLCLRGKGHTRGSICKFSAAWTWWPGLGDRLPVMLQNFVSFNNICSMLRSFNAITHLMTETTP